MRSKKKKKESPSSPRKKEGDGCQSIRAVHTREPSASEANQIERALDRLLTNMVRQERTRRSKSL